MQVCNVVRSIFVVSCLLVTGCGGGAGADSGKVVSCKALAGVDFNAMLGQAVAEKPQQRVPLANEAGYTACELGGDTALVLLQIWQGGGDRYFGMFVDGNASAKAIPGLGKQAAEANGTVYASSGKNLFALKMVNFGKDVPVEARVAAARKVYANLEW